MPLTVRPATPADGAALLAIYAPIVESTAISFGLAPPTLQEFSIRIQAVIAHWAWLVAEQEGHCVGHACAAFYRERPAYRWSVETSAYVATSARRRGIGARLYHQLFAAWASRGYCNAIAGIALPMPPVLRCIGLLVLLPSVYSRRLAESSLLGTMSRGFRSSCWSSRLGSSALVTQSVRSNPSFI